MKTETTFSLSNFRRWALLIFWFIAPAVQAGVFSTFTATNIVNSPDLLLIDSSNGASTFVTRTATAKTFGNSPVQTTGRTFTNLNLAGSQAISNLGLYTIAKTNGSRYFTVSPSGAALNGLPIGASVIFAGNEQLEIVAWLNSSTGWFFTPVGATATTTNFIVDLNNVAISDNTTSTNGFIDNGASAGVPVWGFGYLYMLDFTNTTAWHDSTGPDGFQALQLSGVNSPILSLASQSPYNAIGVLNSGTQIAAYGRTNVFGTADTNYSPVVDNNGATIRNNPLTLVATNLATNGSTLTLVNSNGTITGTSGAFTGMGLGWVIDTSPNPSYAGSYTITHLTSSTSVQVYPNPTASAAGVNWYGHPPLEAAESEGSGSTPVAAIDAFGDQVYDAGSSAGIILASGTNSLGISFLNDGSGPHFIFQNAQASALLELASTGTSGTYDVIKTLADGSVSIHYWLTNFNGGTVNIAGGLTVNNAGLNVAGGGELLNGDLTNNTGNYVAGTAGKGLMYTKGSNARCGTNQFASGIVTVANTSVTANTYIFASYFIQPGAQISGSSFVTSGIIISNTAGTGFTAFSGNVADTNQFKWWMLETK